MISTSQPIEEVALRDLVEFSDNPRTITEDARERLRRSLNRFGLYRPLVVWRDPSGRAVVVAGNQRLALLRERGDPSATVPCVVLDVDERTARLVAIRDNNEEGEWSWEALGSYLSGLASLAEEPLDWGLTGFDHDTVESLLALAGGSSGPAPAPEQVERETVSVARPAPEVEAPPEEEEQGPEIEYPERRFTRVSIGSLRGQVSHETYARWLRVWTAYAERAGSTDVAVVVTAMARVLLRAVTPR